MVRSATKHKGRANLVLTSFFVDPTLLAALKDAARDADLSLGQALRRGAQMWLACQTRQRAVPNLDSSYVNDDWLHRGSKKGGRS